MVVSQMEANHIKNMAIHCTPQSSEALKANKPNPPPAGLHIQHLMTSCVKQW